jgi:protease-4
MKPFFNDKLGITFDAVKTSPDADMLSITKPLNDQQRKWLQSDVDTIYHTFITRVADGRRKELSYIDSIGQGRIWSGQTAVKIGLVDRTGGLNEAISCAARMAKTGA